MDAQEEQDEGTGVERIVKRFGGDSAMARALGVKFASLIQGWRERGAIPVRHHALILDKAVELDIRMEREDFISIPINHPAFSLPKPRAVRSKAA